MRSGWLCLVLFLRPVWAQDEPGFTFGTTVVDSSGLHGLVYRLEPGTQKLPNFRRMRPLGSLYTTALNVWPQHFTEGFPDITERFEWFGIEYTAKVWIEKAGHYRFSLLADDGAKLIVNNRLVIDNDGVHGPMAISASATLTRGVHELKVEYFQGPRFSVVLVLAVARPGEPWRIFCMDDFRPPKNPEEWRSGKISEIRHQTLP